MMKKTLSMLLMVSITCLAANAQKLIVGGKIDGGIAYQQIKGPDILSTGSLKTFNIKGIVQMPLKSGFWLEAEPGIANKGGVFYQDALTTTTHITYLELPVNLLHKWNFTNLGKYYLGAGGFGAEGIKGNIKYETPGVATTDKLKFGANNDLRRFDAGLDFITGFEFRNRVTFNMGYKLGLKDIESIPEQDAGTTVMKNKEFTIGLGYIFK
ncbi:porin family protein [Mucilaginibacter ximonensis]|uniref:Porin family protein n=1 Tax=Mucilaginibacter ximonensis TaxID=538021 RepID=A0ABW5Y743_9SPHI